MSDIKNEFEIYAQQRGLLEGATYLALEDAYDVPATHEAYVAYKAGTQKARQSLLENSSGIPKGWGVVPKWMDFNLDSMQRLLAVTGDNFNEDEFCDFWLWVGETVGDNGEKYYGLNVSIQDYPEEGSIPIIEFERPNLSSLKSDTEHSDDAAVDRFAQAMKVKLGKARAKGRDGWDDPEQCSVEFLANLLLGHIGKGNPGNFEDIANLAMMLQQRGADPAILRDHIPKPCAVLATESDGDMNWFKYPPLQPGSAIEQHRRNNPGWKTLDLYSWPQTHQGRPPCEEGFTGFQHGVTEWLHDCFGPEIARDQTERNHRFLEEALELVQSLGSTAKEAKLLVDYVFRRPQGEPFQEVGGVSVTLAALCFASQIDMEQAGEAELARISQPEVKAKIREKQKRKPSFSPLPGSYPERTPAEDKEHVAPK